MRCDLLLVPQERNEVLGYLAEIKEAGYKQLNVLLLGAFEPS
jgi:hypothetical protein